MSATSENQSGATPTHEGGAPDPAQQGKFLGIDIARVVRVLRERLKLLIAAAVICGLAAYAAGEVFGKPVYQASGTIVYKPLPIPESQKTLIPVDKFETLSGLIKSPHNMEAVVDEFHLGVPASLLQILFTIEDPPFGAEKITIVLKWEDSEEGAKMVNFLMEVFAKHTAEARIALIGEYYRQTDKNLRECKDRLEKATRDYFVILDKYNITDLKTELERATREVSDLDAAVSAKKNELSGIDSQIKQHNDEIAKIYDMIRKKDPIKGKADEAYMQKIRDLSRALAIENGKLAQVKGLLEKLGEERKRIARLVKDRVEPEQTLSALDKEIGQLEPQLKASDVVIKSLKAELDEKQKDPASPYTDRAVTELRRLDALKSDISGQLIGMEIRRKSKKDEAARIGEVNRKAGEPGKKVEMLEAQRKQLEDLLATLDGLKGSGIRELVIESRAKPSNMPVGSNAKKIMMMTFFIPMALLLAVVLGLAMRSESWKAESLADQLRLPVLARVAIDQPRADGALRRLSAEESRGLALRVRQYVSGAGGAILFNSLYDTDELDEVVGELSHYLALRDEKVLIIDARIASARVAGLIKRVERPVEVVEAGSRFKRAGQAVNDPADLDPCQSGLAQYLVFEGQDPAEFIHPTTHRGVYFMPAGGPCSMTDALASDPMKDLLGKLRQQFSVILFVGPPLTHSTDTEILAAYVSGIIVVLNGSIKDAPPVDSFVTSLRAANAPLIGSVICV